MSICWELVRMCGLRLHDVVQQKYPAVYEETRVVPMREQDIEHTTRTLRYCIHSGGGTLRPLTDTEPAVSITTEPPPWGTAPILHISDGGTDVLVAYAPEIDTVFIRRL